MTSYRFAAIPFIAIALLLYACKSDTHSYEYVPLSHFTIDNDAIAPGSAVQILGYSGGKDGTSKTTNYFQFIVLNKESGDTVRVLSAFINIPGDSRQGTYTMPSMFDGSKGILNATFEPKDSAQAMLKYLAMIEDGKKDLPAMQEMLNDTSKIPTLEEKVVINKSLPIFDDPKYKTTIGVLKFSSLPY
jgi:hypothetical protein